MGKFDFLPGAGKKADAGTKVHSGGRGRPSGSAGGKRSNPDYAAITAYVRRDTLGEVKRALVGDERDLSDLTEELFQAWLRGER